MGYRNLGENKMEEELKKIKKDEIISIYLFEEDYFSVGKILKITDKYLFLENYDINMENIGIKIFLLNSIRRVVLKSQYMNNLKELKSKKYLKLERYSIKNIFSKIIRDKVLLSIKLVDGSVETGYLTEIKENKFYFNFLNDFYEINSKEVIFEDYIEKIGIIGERTKKLSKLSKINKIEMCFGEEYLGKIICEDTNYLLLQEKEKVSKSEFLMIIPKDKIERISESIVKNNLQEVNLKQILENLKINLYEILALVFELKLIISIDNKNFNKLETGVIVNLMKNKLSLKSIDDNGFSDEIIEIKYSDIEILQVNKFSFLNERK